MFATEATRLGSRTASGFAGCCYDESASESTHYNYYRDYEPAQGSYVESDPIGLRGGLNTYTYVLNNPLSESDPSGLDVTVTYYPGGPGHIGIGVNSPDTFGLYPRQRGISVAVCSNVPGHISNDRYVQDATSRRKSQSITIRTTPAQDVLIENYINSLRNEGARPDSTVTYNLCQNQCTSFVRDALTAGGIAVPATESPIPWPKDQFDVLQQHYGVRR